MYRHIGRIDASSDLTCLNLCVYIVSRQISGSHAVSLETAQLLKLVVSNAKFSSIDELISSVKEVGRELTLAQPKGKSVRP